MAAVEEKDVVKLVLDENTSVTVHYHGATVTSWRAKNKEQLFLSKNAVFDNRKAIRGGVQVAFPHFGPWDCGPQHGFARTTKWKLPNPPNKADDGSISATFILEDTDATRERWNFRFLLKFKLTLKTDTFSMDFRVDNIGKDTFDFTCLLPTYFRVPNIHRAGILGLKGRTYVDKVKEGEEVVEERELIGITKNYDRIYKNTDSEHCITDGSITLKISKHNFPDTVIWNPWKEKAIEMTDFGDDEYLDMMCVEVGYVGKPIKLTPGNTYKANQTFHV